MESKAACLGPGPQDLCSLCVGFKNRGHIIAVPNVYSAFNGLKCVQPSFQGLRLGKKYRKRSDLIVALLTASETLDARVFTASSLQYFFCWKKMTQNLTKWWFQTVLSYFLHQMSSLTNIEMG